jgi:hypothetical protein
MLRRFFSKYIFRRERKRVGSLGLRIGGLKEPRWDGVVHRHAWPLCLALLPVQTERVPSWGVHRHYHAAYSLLLSCGFSKRFYPALDGEGSREEVYL